MTDEQNEYGAGKFILAGGVVIFAIGQSLAIRAWPSPVLDSSIARSGLTMRMSRIWIVG